MARSKDPGLDPMGYGPYEENLLGEKMDETKKSVLRAVARHTGKPMRLFKLVRYEDESGVSGTGVVAEGVVFGDGTVALRWRGDNVSHAIFKSIYDVERIHGHDGKTQVVYL